MSLWDFIRSDEWEKLSLAQFKIVAMRLCQIIACEFLSFMKCFPSHCIHIPFYLISGLHEQGIQHLDIKLDNIGRVRCRAYVMCPKSPSHVIANRLNHSSDVAGIPSRRRRTALRITLLEHGNAAIGAATPEVGMNGSYRPMEILLSKLSAFPFLSIIFFTEYLSFFRS
jgi:hypothetical protein